METKMSAPNVRGSRHRNPEQEIAELKQKLWEMSTLCQQLQDKFELMENKMRNSEMQTISSALAAETTNGYDVASLKEKMRELVAMNVNWQKYNSSQDKTIQELREKVAQQERELARRHSGQLPESQQIEFDQLLLAKKHQCNTLEEEKERVEDENRCLQMSLTEMKKSSDELTERCQLLEAQLVMYQEDFKTERSDRERAQSKIIELETRLSENLRNQVSSPVQATSGYNPYEVFNHPSPYNMPLRGRGVYQTDGTAEIAASLPAMQQTAKTREGHIGQKNHTVVIPTTSVYQTDGLDETDCYRVVDLTEDLPNHRISLDDVLSCPKCRKEFTRDHHLDLLEHMEECD